MGIIVLEILYNSYGVKTDLSYNTFMVHDSQKIALYPGTFNPVHQGHVEVARRAVEQFHFDKIIFIPAYRPPHKSGDLLPAEHRLTQLQNILQPFPFFDLSDIEYQQEKPSYTYYTVEYYKNLLCIDRVPFIIGSDAFKGLSTWYRAIDIVPLCCFYIYLRNADTWETLLAVPFFREQRPFLQCLEIQGERLDISSTQIRSQDSVNISMP